jgi:hypothetical protein
MVSGLKAGRIGLCDFRAIVSSKLTWGTIQPRSSALEEEPNISTIVSSTHTCKYTRMRCFRKSPSTNTLNQTLNCPLRCHFIPFLYPPFTMNYIKFTPSFYFIHWCTAAHHIPNGLVAMISACHSHRQAAGDQGSIPC